MIPYEELVSALARWRARRGLPTGLGDYLGEPPPAGNGEGVADHSRDDEVELNDELLAGVVEESQGASAYDEQPLDAGDLADFGEGPAEQTRPAGLAGVGSPELDAEPDAPEPAASPQDKGRRGGRRRRK